jgi:hypothetical protein
MDLVSFLKYGIEQDLPNQIATALLLVCLYILATERFRKHFLELAIIPGFLGSAFPDLFYVVFLFVFKSNLHIFSHDPGFLIILAPLSQITVFLFAKIMKRKLPDRWYLLVPIIAVASGWIHLLVDKFGF